MEDITSLESLLTIKKKFEIFIYDRNYRPWKRFKLKSHTKIWRHKTANMLEHKSLMLILFFLRLQSDLLNVFLTNSENRLSMD